MPRNHLLPYVAGLVQERRNSIVTALELRFLALTQWYEIFSSRSTDGTVDSNIIQHNAQ